MRLRKLPPIILCCYAKLSVETERSVKAYAPGALFVDTSAHDYAYRDALIAHWTGERDLIVIEQDIEITRKVVKSFRKCRRDWCSYEYQGPPHLGFLNRCLGCTKFSAELQRQCPVDTWTEGATWNLLDMRIARAIGHSHNPHVHGSLVHHHGYKEIIAGLAPNEVLWVMEMRIDGGLDPVCKELQADGRTFVFYVNPDGTRGAYKREVPPMPKYKPAF